MMRCISLKRIVNEYVDEVTYIELMMAQGTDPF